MASLQRILRPAGTRFIAVSCKRSAPAPCATLATQNGSSVTARYLSSSSPRPSSSGPPPPPAADAIPDGELEVGELQGAKFRIEPLRRTGENPETMRARLQRQSRGRGTLEAELLMSTFAKAHLPSMTPAQLEQYDRFLDENDWDIYYWATQGEAPPAVADSSPSAATSDHPAPSPRPGEWAQTVGTFKPAYRPVPSRWRDSVVLALLRQHVRDRSAGGKSSVGGMAFMPPLNG